MSNQPDLIPNVREGDWAQPVDRLKVTGLAAGITNLNVDGRRVTGPVQGFGQMWQKTYSIRLKGSPVSPQVLIQDWKENFSSFWPKGNYFYRGSSLDGGNSARIEPGQVAILHIGGPGGLTMPGGGPVVSTGILVIYADDESFSFMTPQGHMFAAMITFSAEREGEDTIAQIQALVRASDPLFELSLRLGFGHPTEDAFWMQTLRNLAAHFNAPGSEPQSTRVMVDPRVQWSEAKNIWHNAAIRTTFYTLGAPFRWVGRQFRK